MDRYAIIDVETTGARAERDRLTEIAIVVHDGRKILETFDTLINPECPIPYGITELTGITNEMVANAPRFFEIAKQVVEMTEGAVFVAHNVRFDYGFIREEFKRLGYTYSRRQLCTVRLARKVYPGLSSYSLGNLIRHFGIVVTARHRALADTLATTELFEKMLFLQQGGGEAKSLINLGIKESKLPSGITLEFLHNLPEACGVYYFHDENGDVLYVGKSLNIRKRIMEHFTDQTRKAAALHQYTRDITYEITGGELLALLMESEEIKRLQPPVNRAQRQKQFPYVLHTYTNEAGYICFDIAKPRKKLRKQLQVLNEFPKISHARGALKRVLKEFELCPKLVHLENGSGPCFHFHLKGCHGACAGLEPVETYNERAELAKEMMANVFEHDNFFILDEGRFNEEKSVVMIENGEVRGTGYIDLTGSNGSLEELHDSIIRTKNNPEVRRIIRRYIGENSKVKIIQF